MIVYLFSSTLSVILGYIASFTSISNLRLSLSSSLSNWENGERQCPAYIEKLIVEKILTRQTKTENA